MSLAQKRAFVDELKRAVPKTNRTNVGCRSAPDTSRPDGHQSVILSTSIAMRISHLPVTTFQPKPQAEPPQPSRVERKEWVPPLSLDSLTSGRHASGEPRPFKSVGFKWKKLEEDQFRCGAGRLAGFPTGLEAGQRVMHDRARPARDDTPGEHYAREGYTQLSPHTLVNLYSCKGRSKVAEAERSMLREVAAHLLEKPPGESPGPSQEAPAKRADRALFSGYFHGSGMV
ncbi:hypothetical protein [Variovorax saccharolyticus]|uniref:hypothetical protein n=1 Tax=Variovorax saccharolyticus TaxID=3053516 RepID=UPI0025788437|nr:hypothetical protein [Variovorax sp. J31P216]MDM0030405.1 hypothetical protein [Variovorax sp. J31P216]